MSNSPIDSDLPLPTPSSFSPDVETEINALKSQETQRFSTASTNRFDGSIQDLKHKYPEVYQQVENYLAQNIWYNLKRGQERLIKKMREHRQEQ